MEKAARQLQIYFEKIASVKLPIVKKNESNPNKKKILIGFEESTVFSPQTKIAKNKGENIIIQTIQKHLQN